MLHGAFVGQDCTLLHRQGDEKRALAGGRESNGIKCLSAGYLLRYGPHMEGPSHFVVVQYVMPSSIALCSRKTATPHHLLQGPTPKGNTIREV